MIAIRTQTCEEFDQYMAERSLSEFIKQAWHILEPSTEYLHNWHIDAICEYLQAVDDGQIQRLLINMPPRHMKSIAVTVMWPVWSWIRRPSLQFLFASYAQNLSTQHSVDRRTILQSEWYKTRWFDRFSLVTDQNIKTEYLNNKRGRMFATSFGGIATGKGGDRIIIDDPHDPEGAESQVQRDHAVNVFKRKLSTRLNDKKKGAIVVVMQRLNAMDISNECLKQKYDHLCLRAEDKPRAIITCPGGRQFTRSETGLLWPDREGPKEIAQAKSALGPYGWSGQYQQNPAPDGGGRFKKEYFRYWKKLPGGMYELLGQTNGARKIVQISECRRYTVMDPAGAEKQQNNKPCYTVLMTWDVTPDNDMLLIDLQRGQWPTPQSEQIAFETYERLAPAWVGIEKNGLGIGLVQNLIVRGIPVFPILAQGAKEARSETAEIRMYNRKVYFENEAEYLHDLETELLLFPNGEYCDQVDVLSHSAKLVLQETGDGGDTSETTTEVAVTAGRYKTSF